MCACLLGLCVIVSFLVFVHACPHACMRKCPSTLKGVGCIQYGLSCYFVFVCMHMHTLHLCVALKWSYLSQHSYPMTGGMKGSRGGGGPERDQR